MCLSLQTVSFKEFSRIVYVFHCSVIKVLICFLSRDSLFTISLSKPFVNNFFQLFISLSCFCCDSVASCDSSYRIPRYSYNVNPKIWLFSKIWLFQNLFKFFNSSSISHYDKEYITPSIFFAMYSPFYKLPHWFFQIYLFPFFSSLRHSTINSVGSKKAVSRYIHKHRATLTSTTPRL